MLQDQRPGPEAPTESRMLSEAAETAPAAREPGPRPDAIPPRPDKKPEPGKPQDDNKNDDAADKTGEDKPEDTRSKTRKLVDFVRAHPIGSAIGAIVVVAALVAALLWWLNARHFETTDDAFVDARQFAIAPKVSGYIVDVPVTDNQHISAGQRIVKIDVREYQAALDQARAQINSATANVTGAVAQIAAQEAQVQEAQAAVVQQQAALEFAQVESQRAQDLALKGAGTVQRSQQTRSELVQAQANLVRARATVNAAQRQIGVLQAQQTASGASLGQAQAQLETAELNLSFTEVVSAQPGRVTRLSGARGQLIQAGQAVSMFVPDEIWVTANFKETQLADMRAGQPVDVTIDSYPGRIFPGHVESLQSGSGTAFSLLPAQNATGNYVKVVQRVPVKIVFDDVPRDVTLGPGMSVVPKVRVR